MATEVGLAYVRLLPSMDGFAKRVNSELDGSLKSAGKGAGKSLGDGITDGVSSSSGKLSGAASKVGDIFKAGLATAGVAAAGLLTAGLAQAMDADAAKKKLVAQLGGGEFADQAGEVAGRLYMDAFGDSVGDTADAVKQVLQSGVMAGMQDMSSESLEQATAMAMTFSDVLDQDLNMSLQAVDRMLASGLASSAEEAFDILTTGAQMGVDSSGDLLETFQEYSTQFREIGLSGEEALGLMGQALDAGARDADTAADALKEFAIRAQDGSTASAEGFELIGLSAAEMTAAVAKGGPEAKAALDQTLKGLQAIEDPAQRNAAAVALFGTKAEDLGDALFSLDLEGAAAGYEASAGATDALGSAYDTAQSKITAFKRKALDKIITVVGNVVIPLFERFAEWVGPKLSAAFRSLQGIADQVETFYYVLTSGFTFTDSPIEQFALRVRDGALALWDILSGIVDQVSSFWYTLTSGFTEDEGTPIESFALRLRDVAGIAASAVAWLADQWAVHGPAIMDVVKQVAGIVMDAFDLIAITVQRAVQVALFIWDHWGGELTNIAQTALTFVIRVVQGALDIVQGIIRFFAAILHGDWGAAWSALGQILSGAWQILTATLGALWGLFVGVLDLGFSVLLTLFGWLWDQAKSKTEDAWRAITGWLSDTWDSLVTKADEILQGILAFFVNTFEDIKTSVGEDIDSVLQFFKDLPGDIASAFRTLANTIKSPFESAFNSLVSLWNNTVGGFGFTMPDWIPGLKGKSFSIPKMHTGGIVPGSGDVPIVAKGGEGVFTRQQMGALAPASSVGAGAPTVVQLVADGESRYIEWLRHTVRVEGGGNVQQALGVR